MYYRLFKSILSSQELQKAQKARVDEEIANKNQAFKWWKETFKIVLATVNFIAKYSPTAQFERFLTSLQAVMNCWIKSSEYLSTFVGKLRCLAFQYIVNDRVSHSLQTEKL